MGHKHRYTIVVERKENSTLLQCSHPGCLVTILQTKKRRP